MCFWPPFICFSPIGSLAEQVVFPDMCSISESIHPSSGSTSSQRTPPTPRACHPGVDALRDEAGSLAPAPADVSSGLLSLHRGCFGKTLALVRCPVPPMCMPTGSWPTVDVLEAQVYLDENGAALDRLHASLVLVSLNCSYDVTLLHSPSYHSLSVTVNSIAPGIL